MDAAVNKELMNDCLEKSGESLDEVEAAPLKRICFMPIPGIFNKSVD